MAKKSVFFCSECGAEAAKWMGQCPACKSWNTLTEELLDKKEIKALSAVRDVKPTAINEVTSIDTNRMSTQIAEFDRVLGGGIVKGSMVLVGGDPGIGKSTLLLQTCHKLTNQDISVLYVSGEESLQQIKLRADRIGTFSGKLQLLCETSLETIKAVIERVKPAVVIIDSIQTMYSEEVGSAPGSVSQVRESTNTFMQIAKGMDITIFIVGHVTKEGTVAGPRVLEHMVDTVLYFEGDRHASYRILRGVKNRFGSTNEIGVFEMREEGLVEVSNPSEYMLDGRPMGSSGSIVTCCMEGSRPILVELQALVNRTAFGMPRRTAAGCDANRVNLLTAVLEKHGGVTLGDYDVYSNVAGGLKVNEPAVDLGIILSIYSSFRNIAIPDGFICFGEVGLSGEVRSISMADARVAEAKRLGFNTIILPESNRAKLRDTDGIKLTGVKTISEAITAIK